MVTPIARVWIYLLGGTCTWEDCREHILKKNLNASRSSEHITSPSHRDKMSKRHEYVVQVGRVIFSLPVVKKTHRTFVSLVVEIVIN